MTTAVFDTLKASRDLKAAGIDEAHAEAIVTAMAGGFEETVATKSDLDKLEASVRGDIKLLKWMIGVVLACVGVPLLKSFFV